ncbi:MAG: hypothetical protein COA71_01780 [SAR86 cluster bacterium]|uniref:Uncharacterized protein n=1 Tax=SAR86 cluster bacterium TaxID=2030880 RepID=A0A2A5CIB7_9GAMM|nr:MAG: hypothetical protein COA71_01780 [SAR86 cluster bacterium]
MLKFTKGSLNVLSVFATWGFMVTVAVMWVLNFFYIAEKLILPVLILFFSTICTLPTLQKRSDDTRL